MIKKLHDLFDRKRLELRKMKWEERDWEEYDFLCSFQKEWDDYVKGIGCEVLDCDFGRNSSMKAMVDKWNKGEGRDTFCIKDPEHDWSWIFVPMELAKKSLVLGSLP